MRNIRQRWLSMLLALVLTLGLPVCAAAWDEPLENALTDTAAYLRETVKEPRVASVGGEWAVLGLARSGCPVPEGYFETYYDNVTAHVQACGGVLHARKYTEYSRVILALTAIGKDPTDVGGYDLTAPLGDFDKTVWQGINGAVWALIALDAGGYPLPEGGASRQDYVDHLLGLEIPGGGWALSGDEADTDITAMALQALAKYQDQPAVKSATERALTWLSENQNGDGTYSTQGSATCESTAQVVVALCELGISVEDSRFTKDGNSVMDGLLRYYAKGRGFAHILGSGSDGMATEQGFYALTAASRAAKGESSLYRMVERTADPAAFPDIAGHKNQAAIDALFARQIINGKGDGTFSPDETMDRAQFCTITVKALGLTPKVGDAFSDVPADQWYAGYVGAASDNGIVNGTGDGTFNPLGTISRQEAAVMVARAAGVLGLDTAVADPEEALSRFSDGGQAAAYAKESLAYCYASGILETEDSIQPARAILRCEIAQMIYNMLDAAGKV